MRELIIIRGVPGCGKSTMAELFGKDFNHIEADMYFELSGEYKFEYSQLHYAHKWCQNMVIHYMTYAKNIILSNTCTTDKEMEVYLQMADKYGYRVHILVKENRHGGVNVHNVPEDVLVKMETRLRNSIKLR